MQREIIFGVHLILLLFVVITPSCDALNVIPRRYKVVQRAARDGTTRSITFLSSGYSAKSVDVFNNNVKSCVDALYGKDPTVSAAPWNRYVSLLNIYSVFQASEENDVIDSLGTHQECNDPTKCNKNIAENNLGCTFGIPDPSVISCNLSAVFTLATVAPVSDLIVVLVNKPNNISSTSGNSLAVFTNEPSFLPFFAIRELSKAIANLSSEYNHGINEASHVSIPNCVPSLNEAHQEWGYWMTRGEISETPTQGCFFNNYYRPTENGCIMRNSTLKGMCPICKEQVNLSLLKDKKGISLSAGRCPKEDSLVHVDVSQDLQLTVGDIGVQDDVIVIWRDENGTIINNNFGKNNASLLVPQSSLITWTFPRKIIVSIEDNSPYVRPEKRTELFKRKTTFYLVSLLPNTCNITKCGLFSTCTSCSGSNCSLDIPPKRQEIHWDTNYFNRPSTISYRIVASVISTTAVFLVALVFLFYYFCYYKRPHEVISPQFMDYLLCGGIFIISFILLGLSTYILVVITLFFEAYVVVWRRWIIPSTLTGALIYVMAIANLGFMLFRCFKPIKLFSIIMFCIGIVLIAVGLFLGWTHLHRNEDNLISYVASSWLEAVKETSSVVHRVQSQLKCSGFFVSCLEVRSSYCPKDSESNMYVNSCKTPFMNLIASTYVQLSAISLATGILLIGMAAINIIFFLRFSLLVISARERRSHRTEPNALTLPFTFQEVSEARRLFNAITTKTNRTLEGTRAVEFLQRVFAADLKDAEIARVESSGPLSFEALMALHFPYVDPTRIDPRQLTPDEIFEERGVVGKQQRQYSKLQAFASASGTLAPATLFQIYQKHVKENFITDQEKFLTILREEAIKNCPDAPLCNGLGALELEGLRNVWVQLNPAILGDLSNEQIDVFYQWTHGEPLRDAAHFREWKRSLDVRNRGAIGWGEFCYPFAKRARLRKAREYLSSLGKEIPPEMVSRSLVEKNYGSTAVESVFMIYENEVPIERLVEYFLQYREAELKKNR
ncbi:uncharacterized protein TM35_000015150 [Trypanosoma theileri]|uniref:Uncharacterized protein n=1 Tax=Trypanosoma theileri TaxID=67003 RepID=A0A1X0P9S7_9TRYP|nr:uncharacterized protein TM35_000015150 [Trypanosoma theileri]ORC93638.1 hypothetical protein TM35_000015150 [Trypanosoma theileri]